MKLFCRSIICSLNNFMLLHTKDLNIKIIRIYISTWAHSADLKNKSSRAKQQHWHVSHHFCTSSFSYFVIQSPTCIRTPSSSCQEYHHRHHAPRPRLQCSGLYQYRRVQVSPRLTTQASMAGCNQKSGARYWQTMGAQGSLGHLPQSLYTRRLQNSSF